MYEKVSYVYNDYFSVERLYHQLFKYGHPTLDPLIVKQDGIITVRDDKQNSPQFLCSLFHGHR